PVSHDDAVVQLLPPVLVLGRRSQDPGQRQETEADHHPGGRVERGGGQRAQQLLGRIRQQERTLRQGDQNLPRLQRHHARSRASIPLQQQPAEQLTLIVRIVSTR